MRENAVSFDAGQRAVLEGIALGDSLPRLLEQIVALIESQAEGMLCSIVLVDEQGRLRHAASSGLPERYLRDIDGLQIGPFAGSCGTAAFTGKPVIVDDISSHPAWVEFRHVALPHGLRACWSTPILAPEGHALGTFALYYREVRRPSPRELEWVKVATHLALIALLRDRAERTLRRSEARAHQLARLHAVSSAIKAEIVRARDPQCIYQALCRITLEEGLAQLAWIGLHDAEADRVDVVARCGDQAVSSVSSPGDFPDASACNDLIARAIAGREPVLLRESDTSLPLASGRLKSYAAYPFTDGERTVGAFVLASEQADYFQTEEIRVFSALSSDLSFALESSRLDAQRQRMEEAMRVGETLREVILSSVTDAIYYLAVEPDGYRFVSVNRAFLELFGVVEADIIGRTLDDVLVDAKRARTLGLYAAARTTKQPQTWHEAIAARTGLKHAEITIIPVFDQNGRCVNFVGTVHNITARVEAEYERSQLQSQLHQAQRIQALGTLAGGIAHDFNNILAAITGNTSLVLQDFPPEAPGHEHLVEIQKASRRATDLVRQILTFSRMSPPSYEVIDPVTIVSEALQLLRATLPAKIGIKTHFAANTPRINADSTQLHQIVMNLGTNAVHAMKGAGGTIDIDLEFFDATEHSLSSAVAARLTAGVYARLRVTDHGCGMDAATLKRVFDPFFTTRPLGEGTGLGLSVVHGIVEGHHGAIDIRSEPDRGTTVTIYFPASAARVSPAQKPTTARGHDERIMYVDDEEALVFLMDRALTKMGYRVSGFSEPAVALSEFRRQPHDFDVVITDLSMPGMSGPDLVQELRRIRPDIPVIMTSGYIRNEDRSDAARLNIQQLVYKSNTIDELGALLAVEIGALKIRK